MLRRSIAMILLFAGLGLLALNGYGLAAPIDKPDGIREFEVPADQRARLSDTLAQREGESDEAYFERLTMSIHYRIEHHWPVGPVPLRENYILSALKYAVPSYHNYEYINHEKAIERGYGICTQYSLAVYDVLEEQGFDRRIIQLLSHTFVEATTSSGEVRLLDANYGVVMPYTWEQVRDDPSLVRPHYSNLDPATRPNQQMSRKEIAPFMEDAFASELLTIQVDSPTPQTAFVEPVAYVLKWALPIGAISLALFLMRGKKLRRPEPARVAGVRTSNAT